MPLSQEDRLIQIATPLGENILVVASFSGRESVSDLFEFRLELLSERRNIDPQEILGKNVTVFLMLNEAGAAVTHRPFNGFVRSFVKRSEMIEDLAVYEAYVVPWLWLLTQSSDCAIFQGLNVPDILTKVFERLTGRESAASLSGTHAALDYCVQYRETDYAFASRLMEHEGIFYYFEHQDAKHKLRLGDDPAAFLANPYQETIGWEPVQGSGYRRDEDGITQWKRQVSVFTKAWAQSDFNFETPNLHLMSTVPSIAPLKAEGDMYDYPGKFPNRDRGDLLTKNRMQEAEAGTDVAYGESDARALSAGYWFTFQNHPESSENGKWVTTSVYHEVSQRGFASGKEHEHKYSNTFTAIRKGVPFRPPRVTPKPFVHGPQTAIVVGPSGEEIYTDRYGRIKVQFHWDRLGTFNNDSSCWIRVSHSLAGARWGEMSIPRIGQEVVVSFLEGDPDRPIVTGTVYNTANMPPYTLPDEKTKTTFKSQSSIGGEGFNELRFEDKKGSEQVFLHGEKDLDLRVKHDRKEWIGNDRHLRVIRDKFQKVDRDEQIVIGRDRVEKVTRDHFLKIGGKESIEITGTRSMKVTGNVTEQFQGNHTEEVTQSYLVKGNMIVLDAQSGLTLKVGGNFITINSAGIQIRGAMVLINSGGAPLSVPPGSLVPATAPVDAVDADNAVTGQVSQVRSHPRFQPSRQIQFLAGQISLGSQAPVEHSQVPPAPPALLQVDAPAHDPREEENREKKSWVEIKLVDEEGNPVPGEMYAITLGDETIASGTLDEKGFARVDHIDPGQVRITFPNLDKDAWEPK
ncbi:MAG: type VI secretion system tip protein VgrG [Bryobacteraceae bacterium]|nr:type VI secretion system tip protein VgrG [Bryobacteraceae bacterium]